jgi:hypothetical protein
MSLTLASDLETYDRHTYLMNGLCQSRDHTLALDCLHFRTISLNMIKSCLKYHYT